jgi:DNA-directed RNA polymerase subunit RPC12/RpoP
MGDNGVRKCPACNKEFPPDAVFCPDCGNRLEEEKIAKEVTSLKCSSCGKEFPSDAVFCTHCGTRLEKENTQKENTGEITCSACGHELPPAAVFCANCGRSLSQSMPSGSPEKPSIREQFLELANELLSVKEVQPGRFEFSSQTGAGSPIQKARIHYDAIAHLEPDKKQLIFWEKMVESSAGSSSGFFSEKIVQKGLEVSKTVHGNLLFGGKYGFEYGKLRGVIKAIAAEHGWKFKIVIFKPKA